jgi:hypothetical protein
MHNLLNNYDDFIKNKLYPGTINDIKSIKENVLHHIENLYIEKYFADYYNRLNEFNYEMYKNAFHVLFYNENNKPKNVISKYNNGFQTTYKILLNYVIKRYNILYYKLCQIVYEKVLTIDLDNIDDDDDDHHKDILKKISEILPVDLKNEIKLDDIFLKIKEQDKEKQNLIFRYIKDFQNVILYIYFIKNKENTYDYISDIIITHIYSDIFPSLKDEITLENINIFKNKDKDKNIYNMNINTYYNDKENSYKLVEDDKIDDPIYISLSQMALIYNEILYHIEHYKYCDELDLLFFNKIFNEKQKATLSNLVFFIKDNLTTKNPLKIINLSCQTSHINIEKDPTVQTCKLSNCVSLSNKIKKQIKGLDFNKIDDSLKLIIDTKPEFTINDIKDLTTESIEQKNLIIYLTYYVNEYEKNKDDYKFIEHIYPSIKFLTYLKYQYTDKINFDVLYYYANYILNIL